MKKTKTLGILAKQINYSDSSLVLTFFTREYGVIGVLAKGQRKNTEKEQLVNLCEYDLVLYEPRESGLWLMGEYSLTRDFGLYAHPDTWSAAECGMELTSQLFISPEEHKVIYSLLLSYLDYLTKVKKNAILIYWRYFLRIIRHSGIGSPFDNCCYCHEANSTLVALEQANTGLVCSKCFLEAGYSSAKKLSDKSALVIALLPRIGFELDTLTLGKQEVIEINQILENYWSNHHKQTLKLKSLSVLIQFYQ
ncbi:MAG: DNA repair protein RecO [Candidatus Cloacimonetes bacterium]|nr:DNA repair protein RecO [Candidatus Cloacimonadota bacterium]